MRLFWSPSVEEIVRLSSPSFIIGEHITNPILSFIHTVDYYAHNFDLAVQISTDDGSSWQDLWRENITHIAAKELK